MSRQNQILSEKEKRFVAAMAEGKSKAQAAREAGYSDATAAKKSFAMVERPLIRSALTQALLSQGVSLEKITRPIIAGLEATLTVVKRDGSVLVTDVPDHRMRGESVDRAIALLGGIARAQEKPLQPPAALIVNISEHAAPKHGSSDVQPEQSHEPLHLTIKCQEESEKG